MKKKKLTQNIWVINNSSSKRLVLAFVGTLLFIILCMGASAQKAIIGKVKSSENNQPIPRASILIKETEVGTTTNEDGVFNIKALENQTLLVTAVGFEAKEIKIEQQKMPLNILLENATKNLEEVEVVTALGIKRQSRSLGYSAQVVTNDQLTDALAGNWTDALQGKVAGLDMVKSNGGPDGSNKIILRGENNIGGDNEALIIVDGVVTSGSGRRSGTNSGESAYGTGSDNQPADYGSGLNDINPEDIESVTVLKGPGAAALYGARGANGAIIITTRSGSKNGKTNITLRSNANMETINRWPDLQYQYGQGLGGAQYYSYGTFVDGASTSGTSSAYGPRFDGQMFYQYNGGLQAIDSVRTLWRPYKNQIRDFFTTGQTYTNSISVEGGSTGKTTSRLAYTNVGNTWIIPNTGYKRNTVSMAFNTKFSEKLTVTTNVNYTNKNSDNLPGAGYGNQSLMYWFIFWQPNANLDWLKHYWANGQDQKVIKYPYSSFPENPYAITNEYINKMDRNSITGNVQAKYNFTKEISLMVRTSLDMAYEQRAQERPWDAGTKMPFGSYRTQDIYSMEQSTDFLLKYEKKINKNFDFSATLGGSTLKNRYNRNETRADSLVYPGIYSFANAAGVLLSYPYKARYATNSFYGLITASYKKYLYFDLTGRNDWTSTLATPSRINNAGFFYPSANTSFVLSDAFKLPEAISFARLRFSVAGVGSGGTKPYLTSFNYTSAGSLYGGSLQNPSTLANPNLEPLKTISFELGASMAFFQNRLSFDLAVYNGNTKNQILPRIIDRSSGFANSIINAGKVNNKGLELTMSATPVQTRSFRWTASINYSTNRNTIISLPDSNVVLYRGPQGGTQIIAKPGGSMGDLYGIGFLRAPDGQVIYDPVSGIAQLGTDIKYLGNTTPKGRIGFGNKFSFKRYSLNVLFDAQFGGVGYSLSAYKLAEQGKTVNTLPGRYSGIIGNGVVQDVNGKFVKNTIISTDLDEFYRAMYGANNGEGATYATDFIKFREATFSYSLSTNAIKKLGLKKLTVGVYGRDLLVWSPWPGFDPEFGTFSGTDIVKGFETGQFPSSRSFGVNIVVGL